MDLLAEIADLLWSDAGEIWDEDLLAQVGRLVGVPIVLAPQKNSRDDAIEEAEEAEQWAARRARPRKVPLSELPQWWLRAQRPFGSLPLKELVLEDAEILGRNKPISKRASFLARDLGFFGAGEVLDANTKRVGPPWRAASADEQRIFADFVRAVGEKEAETGDRLEWRLALARALGEKHYEAALQALASLRGESVDLDDLARRYAYQAGEEQRRQEERG